MGSQPLNKWPLLKQNKHSLGRFFGGGGEWEGYYSDPISLAQWTRMDSMSLSKLWEIVKNREVWRAAVQSVAESDTTEQLTSNIFIFLFPERQDNLLAFPVRSLEAPPPPLPTCKTTLLKLGDNLNKTRRNVLALSPWPFLEEMEVCFWTKTSCLIAQAGPRGSKMLRQLLPRLRCGGESGKASGVAPLCSSPTSSFRDSRQPLVWRPPRGAGRAFREAREHLMVF